MASSDDIVVVIRIWTNIGAHFAWWFLMMGLLQTSMAKVPLAKILLAHCGFKTAAWLFGLYFGACVHLFIFGVTWVKQDKLVGLILLALCVSLSATMSFIKA